MPRARLLLCVLAPFAAGFYLSYVFRSINALIAGDLSAELGLSAADLGLLTSMYFLVFAAVLLPCGVLLDRYGPRLVDSALFLVAAAGSLVFALADGVVMLLLGRALIGLGVAVGLIAGLKAIVTWFPPQRVPMANGWFIMLGALGAVSATGPAELLVHSLGWRGLFAILAVASALVALLILLIVPESKQAPAAGSSSNVSFSTVFTDARYWRIAPLASTGAGIPWSLQGLWAAPWLTDVSGLDRSAVVEHLTLMAAAMSASALVLGALAERLRRAGLSTELFLSATLVFSMVAQLALLLGVPFSSHVLFAVIATAGATPVLSFAILARYFPKEIAGRANAALGVPQHGLGVRPAVPRRAHHRPVAGGRWTLSGTGAPGRHGGRLALQLVGLGIFLTPKRSPQPMPMGVAVARVLGVDPSIAAGIPAHYATALSAWRRHVADVRRQTTAWRYAAAASMTLCVGLVGALSMALRPAEAFHVVLYDRPSRISAGNAPDVVEATMTFSPWAPRGLVLEPAAHRLMKSSAR
jgi:predicted MFS family arabinose efflux permease